MIPAPIPTDDERRLQALREMLILDTPPEERFDRVVKFASEEFDMPMVLVSLVDAKRQWFKARVGLDACETDRDVSFCGHAIMQPQILVVEDSRRDSVTRRAGGGRGVAAPAPGDVLQFVTALM